MEIETKAAKTMTCGVSGIECQRLGKHRNGLRRRRCPLCEANMDHVLQEQAGADHLVETAKTDYAVPQGVWNNGIPCRIGNVEIELVWPAARLARLLQPRAGVQRTFLALPAQHRLRESSTMS
jgi:hypothetical protein